jgi:hypothetical protein
LGLDKLIIGVVLATGVISLCSSAAFASGKLHVNPSTHLVRKETVRVTGSGLAGNAFGYILECNRTPGEPIVKVGAPFDRWIPVGCSPPSLKHLVSTSRIGTLSTTFQIHEGIKVGPPCGTTQVFGGCGRTDSSGQHPRSDAHNYPCPPTPAQTAKGVKCSLVFYDTADEVVSAPVTFLGG